MFVSFDSLFAKFLSAPRSFSCLENILSRFDRSSAHQATYNPTANCMKDVSAGRYSFGGLTYACADKEGNPYPEIFAIMYNPVGCCFIAHFWRSEVIAVSVLEIA